MLIKFPRRSVYGVLLAASLAATASAADDRGYANPHLLVTVAELAPIAAAGVKNGLAATALEGTVLVDVRPAKAFDAGHIPGARHLAPNAVADPMAPVNGALKSDAEIAEILGALGITADTRVIFYDDKGGFHASRMFWLAEYLGHRNVALLDGGITAWEAAGHHLSTRAVSYEAGRFAPAVSPRRLASADYILQREDDAETVVIDVRPAKAYAKGHIPWAKNVPWKGNLTAESTFKSAAELADRFASHGVTDATNVVIHCQTGLASSHSYVALRLLGHAKLRVYHRSWAEWGQADDLPKATGT